MDFQPECEHFYLLSFHTHTHIRSRTHNNVVIKNDWINLISQELVAVLVEQETQIHLALIKVRAHSERLAAHYSDSNQRFSARKERIHFAEHLNQHPFIHSLSSTVGMSLLLAERFFFHFEIQ